MRLSTVFLVLPALLALSHAESAHAQKPVIRPSVVPESARFLNIEEIEDDGLITLEWSATVNTFDTYEFELSYDNSRTTQTTTVTLIRLDDELGAGENTGTVQSGRLERFRIHPSQIIPTESLPGGTKTVDDATRNIVLRVYRASSPLDEATAETAVYKFQYDTKLPPAPAINEVVAGENRLEVRWTAPSPDTDVDTYAVGYCPDINTSTASEFEALPCESPAEAASIDKTETKYAVDQGLRNGVLAAVAVRSTDKYGNKGSFGQVRVGRPTEVTDYFELEKELGSNEDGGFCFIATAAYGSYAHPTVRVLRAFRDVVLAHLPGGTSLIELYYASSPPLADEVASHPFAAAYVRAMLVPVAGFAVLWMLSPLLALAGAGLLFARRKRWAQGAAAALVVATAASFAGSAHASEALNRSKSESPRFGVGFEFKGGPYLPAMGDEGRTPNNAFELVYNSRERPLYSVGADLQLYRGIGTAGLGASFGFMQFVGKAFYGVGGPKSADTTVFNLMPLTLGVFYRFDWLADRTVFPLVPYFRGGLAYHLWWVTTGTGDISRWDGPTESASDDVAGRGGKFGYFGTAGMSIMLNVIDMDAARALFDSTSIRGTYVFLEYQVTKVDGFGSDGFDLSDNTWNLGFYFEW